MSVTSILNRMVVCPLSMSVTQEARGNRHRNFISSEGTPTTDLKQDNKMSATAVTVPYP